MSDLYWLSEAQMERLRPYFPKSHGVPCVDDRRVLRDRVPLEIFIVSVAAHRILLASNLAKKASTIYGALQGL